MSKQVVSFYYPTNYIGGAQLLFARVAEYLNNKGFYIKIYENKESYISNFLKRKNISFDSINIGDNRKFAVGHSEIFLLSLSYLNLIINRFDFNANTRFVFWDLHPYCLIEQTAFSGFYKKISNDKIRKFLIRLFDFEKRSQINKIIELGTKKSGVVFLCNYNFQYNKNSFGFNTEAKYLPIPIEILPSDCFSIENSPKCIRLGWISRLVRDKNLILTLLIDDIIRSRIKNLELVIIGEGKDENYIHEYINKTGVQNIKFIGKVEAEDLSQFLIENIDLGFSMGTSSLEFALRKIPSVLVPTATEYQYFSKKNEKYEWLQNIGEYDICTYKSDSQSYKTFESIINYYTQQKQSLQKEAYNYVLKHHAINKVGEDLNQIFNKCSFNFTNLKEIGINSKSILGKLPFIFKSSYKKVKSIIN